MVSSDVIEKYLDIRQGGGGAKLIGLITISLRSETCTNSWKGALLWIVIKRNEPNVPFSALKLTLNRKDIQSQVK